MVRQNVTVKVKMNGVERTFTDVDVTVSEGSLEVSRDGKPLVTITIGR